MNNWRFRPLINFGLFTRMSKREDLPKVRIWLRIGSLLAFYAVIIVAGHYVGRFLQQHLGFDAASPATTGILVLLVGLVIYVVLLALPFVPGIEISIALFAIFGASVALPIYVATLAALMISYGCGRHLALGTLAVLFDFIGLKAGSALVRRLEGMDPQQRVAVLIETAPTRIVPWLVQYRELALIAALNLPGNGLIGGGGGIALLAGMSGAFPMVRFLPAICVASLPIPLMMAFSGYTWSQR